MLGTDIIAWYGRHWLLHIGFAFLQVVFACLEFRGKAWYGRHWLVLIGFASLQVVFVCSWISGQCLVRTSLVAACWMRVPFKLSSSVHGVSGQCLVRTSLVAAYWIRFPSSCLRLFIEFRGSAWYGLPRGASTSSLIIMQLVGETQVVFVGR